MTQWAVGEALGADHRADHNSLSISATRYGAVGDGTTDDTAALQAAIDDADAAGTAHSSNHASNAPGETWTVYVPRGIYRTTGLDLDGKNVNLVGDGPAATRFRADPDIAGYVISMEDYAGHVAHFRGGGPFGGFSVEGTHTADATKATGGIKLSSGGGVKFSDISIFGTGGPALRVTGTSHFSIFDKITLQRPVGADANDVPYLHVTGPSNGVLWIGLGLRSVSPDLDGSAAVLFDKGTIAEVEYQANRNYFLTPWIEALHTPENGAIFDIDSLSTVIDEIHSFDNDGESGATNNCWVRFNGFGNEVRGWIPGTSGAVGSIAYGVIVEGNSNRIAGRRGYRDNNVLLTAGVQYNHVELGGMDRSTPSAGNPAVVDNSGNDDNTVVVWTEDGNPPASMTFPELKLTGDMGFFGATPVSQPSVTGATDTTKLTSLLAALDSLGLISDDTT